MIIKVGMVQEQFDDLVSKIDSKHKTIGIKDKGLVQRLAKLYSDIYCADIYQNGFEPNSNQ